MPPMNVFYEEDGGFKAGAILAEQGGALQVESATGKRVKVKSSHVLLQFKEPEPAALLRAAEDLAQTIDLDFLWECAPQAEFAHDVLGADYFGHAPTAVESAALLLRLHGAPMYFYRKGRGHYRPAPADSLKAALAAIERKKQQAVLQAEWAAQLTAGILPEGFAAKVRELLFRPDKNSIEYKALDEACKASSLSPARLMLKVGALPSARHLHLQRFLFEHFPRGTGFPELEVPQTVDELPLAGVSAFSVDDHLTTEIDDAFSVERIAREPKGDAAAQSLWRVGIHIAAPALAMQPGDPMDAVARDRLSTVYMPGDKITMLPDPMVERFTLAAGRACPALSLYVDVDPDGWKVVDTHTRVERVTISHNLRHNALDDLITEENLASGAGEYPCKAEIAVLWPFANALYELRQEARTAAGLRREVRNRADYNFYVTTRDGAEHVEIVERRRDAPLDKLVAELMILANSTWGKLLADHGVPGIYRTQQGWGAAGRVRMLTQPAPHQGLGVAQYAWSTSPLRRYVDMVNQWQLLACVRDRTAPFRKNDAELFAIVSAFDAAYAAYADIQTTMERYWCLRWVEQELAAGRLRVTEAVVQREDWARLAAIPLQFRVPGLPALPRGNRIEVEMIAVDLVDLTVECRLLAVIEEVDDSLLDDEPPAGEVAPGGLTEPSAEPASSDAADAAMDSPAAPGAGAAGPAVAAAMNPAGNAAGGPEFA